MRARIVLGVAIAWLVAASPGLAADRIVERGIVQSVSPTTLVLRALDGAELEVPVDPRTRVRLNGLPAPLLDVRPGFVAEAIRYGSRPAVRVRAFGRIQREVQRGRLVRIGGAALVLRRAGAGRLRIALTERTVARRNGRVVGLRALRRGAPVEVRLAADGTARVVRLLRPGA